MLYIDSQPDYDITDIEKTREYKVKQILCILNKEYEEYKLLNDLNGVANICPHGYQDNNYDCALFTILHAEHISQKGIKDLNKKVKQSTISSKKIRNKIYSILATYQKKDFQYFYERYKTAKNKRIFDEPEKFTLEATRPLLRGPQEKPVYVKPNATGNPLIDVLDIDHKEHAKEITSADFHTYGIHTKCFVTCQIPDDYYNNYLMHFIKEDDRKIQARKKTACERAFSFVNSELKATYQKKTPKESKHECDDKGNEINYYQDEDDSDSVESNAYDINPRRGLDLLLVRNEYAINMEHVRRLKEAIMYHHIFDIGF